MDLRIPTISVYDKNGNKISVPAMKGNKPIKGVDYFTETDKSEIVDEVVSNLTTDSEFITKSTTELENYYTKQETDNKVEDLKNYITPEMYGAVPADECIDERGNYITDLIETSTAAIQACVNKALELKTYVLFSNNYIISNTITVDSKNSYASNGILIDGANRKLSITTNKPLFIMRGSGNTIKNLRCTYANSLFHNDPDKERYTSSMIVLDSNYENDTKICFNNSFINVVLQPPNLSPVEWSYNNAGFELRAYGKDDDENDDENKVYSYCHNFIDCTCYNLGTAIVCNGNEANLGINGNNFGINSWACDVYLGGNLEIVGNNFTGVVQIPSVKYSDGTPINKYAITNPGQFNEFSVVFHDIKYDDKYDRQMIAENLGKYNVYTKPVHMKAVKDLGTSKITTYGSYTNLHSTTPFSFSNNEDDPDVMHILPVNNSLNEIKQIKMICENVSVVEDQDRSWDAIYGEVGENNIPVNVAPLFHDDYAGRKTPYLVFKDGGKITFKFTTPVPVNQLYMYVLFLGYNGHIDNVTLINDSTGQRFNAVIRNSNGRCYALANFAHSTAADTFSLEITATPDEGETSKTILISQITGSMYSYEDGIIGISEAKENNIVIEHHKQVSGGYDVLDQATKFEGRYNYDNYTDTFKDASAPREKIGEVINLNDIATIIKGEAVTNDVTAAFDGTVTTGISLGGSGKDYWIGIKFDEPTILSYVRLATPDTNGDGVTDAPHKIFRSVVEGSNDGVNWTFIMDFGDDYSEYEDYANAHDTEGENYWIEYAWDVDGNDYADDDPTEPKAYTYYRVWNNDGNDSWGEVEFWGYKTIGTYNYYELDVCGGDMYELSCPYNTFIAAVYMFDKKGKLVCRVPEQQPNKLNRLKQELIKIPENVTSIRFHEITTYGENYLASINKITDLKFIETERPWDHLYKKKLACVGDSITEAKKPSKEGEGCYKNYAEIVAERHSMTVYKDGVSGSTMGKIDYEKHTDPTLVPGTNVKPFSDESRYTNVPDDFDILTIWFGWNDHAYGKLGSIDGTSEEDDPNDPDVTFYGAYSKVLEYYLTKYPTKKIGLIVPYGRIPSIQQAVRDLSKKYGIPCLDLADGNQCSSPWWYINETWANPTEWQKARTNALTYDTTHPNQAGHEFLSTMYEAFISRL